MTKNKLHNLIFWCLFALIMILALSVRVYRLGDLPNGFSQDEAANGYDAYCILKTGKSLYNHCLPIFFIHHGSDYVESMYTYLSIPFISLFGLTIFSTRLLAAFAGIWTILTTFLLSRELFNKSVGLVATFLVAFSPWHLVFSRIAFRGILLPLFITLGLYLFLISLKNCRYCIPCGLVFGLALHTYAIAKAFVPLLSLSLLLFYRKNLIKLIKANRRAIVHTFAACALFFIVAFPVYYFSFLGPANTRFQQISIFNNPHPVSLFVQNYWLHLKPHFLFFHGDSNQRHSLPGFGEVLIVLIPFVLLGIGIAIKKRTHSHLLPLLVFLLGIIPSALTDQGIPHALRAIGALPFLEIVAAVGIVFSISFFFEKSRRIGIALVILTAIALSFNSVMFLRAYFGKYRMISQYSFQYGIQEAIGIAEKDSNHYDHIIVSDSLGAAYIFVLFFVKPDPVEYQKKRTLGKYVMFDRKAPFKIPSGHNLFILNPHREGDNNLMKVKDLMNVKKLIQDMNGDVVVTLFESK